MNGFAAIPVWLLRDESVSDRAKSLFLNLSTYVNRDGLAWPSQQTLSEIMRCSVPTVQRAQYELQELGLIEVESVTTPKGKRNYYRLGIDRFGRGVPSPVMDGVPSPMMQELDLGELKKAPAKNPPGSSAGKRSARPIIAAWVDGHEQAPTQQEVRKFAGHARDLVNELRRQNHTLSDVSAMQWQRVLDTATLLGASGRVNITAAYYGSNGDAPILPTNGNYQMSGRTAYTW